MLTLTPGPGLTIVVGRNGSGKSSLAEGIEVALTGTTHRFGRSAVWRNGWRNVHGTGDPYVRVAVQLPGSKGVTEIERRLVVSGTANELPNVEATTQRPGEKRTSFDALGWAHPLETMRPFLNHAEVESILEEKPTALHDRIGMALGMEAMDATIRRIAEFRSRWKQPPKRRVRTRRSSRLCSTHPPMHAPAKRRCFWPRGLPSSNKYARLSMPRSPTKRRSSSGPLRSRSRSTSGGLKPPSPASPRAFAASLI